MGNYGLAMRVSKVALSKEGLALKKKGLSRNLARKNSVDRSCRSVRTFFGDGVLDNDRNSLQYRGALCGQVIYGIRGRRGVIKHATFFRNPTRRFYCIMFRARYHGGGNGFFVKIYSRKDLLGSLYDRFVV